MSEGPRPRPSGSQRGPQPDPARRPAPGVTDLRGRLRSGFGSPEGVVLAGTGVLYQDTDPAGSGKVWRKTTPSGKTGWSEMAAGGGSTAITWVDLDFSSGTLQSFPGARTAQAGLLEGTDIVFLRGAVSVVSPMGSDYMIAPGLGSAHTRYVPGRSGTQDPSTPVEVILTVSDTAGDAIIQPDFPTGQTGNFYIDGGFYSL